MAIRHLLLASIATCLAAGIGATAGVKTHVVSDGESASSIAKRYYGDMEAGDLLLRYNGRTGTVIRVGETLKIPYCEVHRVARGDSWSSLATRYLGRTKAYGVLAELNGSAADDVLHLGEPIVIPVVFSYQLQRGDALASLAGRFYGDPNRAGLLQGFNEVGDPRRLSVGETVKIPLVSLRLRKKPAGEPPREKAAPALLARAMEKVPPEAPAGEKPPPERPAPVLPEPGPSEPEPAVIEPTAPAPPAISSPRFEEEIREAARAYAEGDFAGARKILETRREEALTGEIDEEKADLLRLLAFVYIAFDMRAEACAAYGSVPELDAEERLDPDLVSPKIREALSQCQGPLSG